MIAVHDITSRAPSFTDITIKAIQQTDKFSREFKRQLRSRNLWDTSAGSNSLENLFSSHLHPPAIRSSTSLSACHSHCVTLVSPVSPSKTRCMPQCLSGLCHPCTLKTKKYCVYNEVLLQIVNRRLYLWLFIFSTYTIYPFFKSFNINTIHF